MKKLLSILTFAFVAIGCYAQNAALYKTDAEKGIAKAQYELGRCYEQGSGVAKDSIEAVSWYRKAAKQGYADAQYNLGLCYGKGIGVEKNMTTANYWINQAADQGSKLAKALLK